MHAAPMYIAETAVSQIRGRLISLKEFFIVTGMVVSSSSFSGIFHNKISLLFIIPFHQTIYVHLIAVRLCGWKPVG